MEHHEDLFIRVSVYGGSVSDLSPGGSDSVSACHDSGLPLLYGESKTGGRKGRVKVLGDVNMCCVERRRNVKREGKGKETQL